MRIAAALLLDAYRELNSRRLFWIVLLLSGACVLVYGSIGFDTQGMFFFFGLTRTDSELLRDGSPIAKLLYRGIFATFIVPLWLAWIAAILALISTASIFPEFIAGGSIDLVLCKPIARLRLFLYKYCFSLLFVVLQVTFFCVGVFLCMGWRLGDWDARIFLAVPLVTLFFSYLFAFCVLVGIWTRSALAALLITLLLWFSLFSINGTQALLLKSKFQHEVMRERMSAASTAAPDVDEITKRIEVFDRWLGRVEAVRWGLPKTSETIGLMDRALSREGDVNLFDLLQGRVFIGPDGQVIRSDAGTDAEVERRMMQNADQQSAWSIIGSSLLFEAVVLGLAAWLFCRRDY